jgi:hypothetical protein
MKAASDKKKLGWLPRGPTGAGLKIELPFEDAIRAALETPPKPEQAKPKRRRA